MIVIYFKNADGEVCGRLRTDKCQTLQQVKDEIERVIASCGGGLKACARLVRRRRIHWSR